MVKQLFLILTVSSIIGQGCKPSGDTYSKAHEDAVRNRAELFFETFSERTDWDKFCSFYRDDVRFEDVILQLQLDSLWQLKRFYKWDEEGSRFKKLSPEQKHLNVRLLVVDGDQAIAVGNLNPFYYDGELIDEEWGMEFVIRLRFDQELKIIEQTDWMEYDPITLENTVKRCREHGFKTTPSWLNLSKP